ncbi:MAG: hypothetical protein EB143_07135 [Actinobacteria bacterium]|nr:hypothetical protein [Actinomycetota bacterium]
MPAKRAHRSLSTVSQARRLSDGPAYRYLPRSVSYLPNRDRLCQMLADAGFDEVTHRQLSGGLTQLITATRR